MPNTDNTLTLSIVVINLNTRELTIDCLRSIEKEAKNITFEVLVVDNGSADGSVEALKKLGKEKYWSNKIILIFNRSNVGYAKANNMGIKKAKGKYILLLNNDTIVHKNSLQNLISFAEATADAGVVGSKLLNTDGSLQPSCFNFPTLINAVREYWLGESGHFSKFAPNKKTATTVDSVVGAAFLITPLAKVRVGLLDERYFAYFEDIDYCRNVWKSGLKVYYLPTSEITHYHGATFKKLANEAQRWKKLIPSSKIYHGLIMHYLLYSVVWSGQKLRRLQKMLFGKM